MSAEGTVADVSSRHKTLLGTKLFSAQNLSFCNVRQISHWNRNDFTGESRCLLLTQSGHWADSYRTFFNPLRCLGLSLGEAMRRREVITFLCGAAAWPLAARAQRTAKVARIGFLGATTPSSLEGRLNRFRAGLRDLGYIEGQNLLIDFRWAEGNYARLEEFAVELVRLNVDVIVTHGTPGTLAAKQATATLPIVMLVSGDAVATGIVASLSHPGGNVTGTTFFDPELHAKRLEICKQTFPAVRRIGILLNPNNPVNARLIQAMQQTAESLTLELLPFEVQKLDDLQSAGASMKKAGVEVIAVTSDAVFNANPGKLGEVAASQRIPLIGPPEFAAAGAVIGYGVNFPDLWYRGAFFVDKILKGAKPADLPVERPTKFDLVVNRKIAKALGLTIPQDLIVAADEVIE
jgi:putative tryptophan/tyrosine transport system substrate-binding protein